MSDKGFVEKLLYVPKHAEPEKPDKIMAMIMPSIIGIVLCLACLFGLTWAWFTTAATSKTSAVAFSKFDYTVSVAKVTTDENNVKQETAVACTSTSEETEKGIFKFYFEADTDYTITFAVTESNTANGYYTLEKDGTKYYVGPITTENTASSPFVRSIRPGQSGEYILTAQWGSHAGGYNLPEVTALYAVN